MQDVDDRAPADDDSPTSDDSESLRNESSLLAGVTRSAASTLRQLGISSAALGGYIRKRAFLNLGSLAAKHGPEESVISDKRAHNRVGKGEKSYKISYRIAATVKLTLEGFATFGVYDLLILQDWFFPRKETSKECKSFLLLQRRDSFKESSSVDLIHRPMEATPIVAHFVAGALAGIAQSLIMDLWEINMYSWNHNRKQSFYDTLRKGVNLHLVYRRLLHSAASHSILFGSYEVFRRSLLQGSVDFFVSYPTNSFLNALRRCGLVTEKAKGVYDMTVIPISTTFLAGGFAGQAHAAFTHYASHWKMRNHSQRLNFPLGRIPKHPSLRMLARGFIPSALAFTVFEHGADLMMRYMDVDDYLATAVSDIG